MKAHLTSDQILKGWEANLGGIDSLELTFNQTAIDVVQNPDSKISLEGMLNVTWFDHRIEQGQNYKVTDSKVAYDGIAGTRHAYDGVVTMEHWIDNRTGSIVRGTVGRNTENNNAVWQYMLMGKGFPKDPPREPLFKQMLNGACTIRPELETVNGELCHVVQTNAGGRTYVLWIAEARGMLLMKYTSDSPRGDHAEMEVWEVATSESNGVTFYYPKHACWITESLAIGRVVYDLQVDSFEPNVKIEDNTFHLLFPIGTSVSNHVTGIDFTADGRGGALPH